MFQRQLLLGLATKRSKFPTYSIWSKKQSNYGLQWSSIGTNFPLRDLVTVHTNVDFTEFTLGTMGTSLTLSRLRQLSDKTLGYLKMVTCYHRCSRGLIEIEISFQLLALSRAHRLYNSFRISSLLCFWKTVENPWYMTSYWSKHYSEDYVSICRVPLVKFSLGLSLLS